jgi:hypothetical protein
MTAKIISNPFSRKTPVTNLISTISKNFYDFLVDTNDTINKKTLHSELEALGWKIKNGSIVSPPTISRLLGKNNDFKTIFDTKPFSKFDKGFAIPLEA